MDERACQKRCRFFLIRSQMNKVFFERPGERERERERTQTGKKRDIERCCGSSLSSQDLGLRTLV